MGRLSAMCTVWLLTVPAVVPIAACQHAPGPAASGPVADRLDSADRQAAGLSGPGERAVAIYVESNGWHSAIVVPSAALPPGTIPEAADFPGAAYLSFSWGDAEYFPAPETTLGMSLRAALQPTPAVVQLAGLPSEPGEVFPMDEVVELAATPRHFAALVAYLDATFDREGRERARASAPGLDRLSLFYPATGEFHLFNTCNTWTARGLGAAGWPIRVSGVVTAEDLMVQVRALAKRQGSALPAGTASPDPT
jgi:uncharacterized protein (TIGR02117 family)